MLILYIKLIGASLIGLFIMLLFKSKSLREKTTSGNIQFKGVVELIKDDIGRIIGTLLTITLLFLLFGKAIDPDNMEIPDDKIKFLDGWLVTSRRHIYEGVLVALFSTVGYTGVDIALRIFSKVNSKINKALDHKTTKSDIEDGLDPHVPTPK
jgi:hypothetical protein